MSNLPQVIILYGPPAAGKGTQALRLKQMLPDYYHLDFGTELRKFVTDHIGPYQNKEEVINPTSTPEQVAVARSLKDDLQGYRAAKTENLRFVIENAVIENISAGKGMIMEGPGRLVPEAEWLSTFFKEHNVTVAFFHLHLNLEEVVRRSTTRWYAPGVKSPFTSYKDAKLACDSSEEPFQRPEDTDSVGITQRYHVLYSDHFAKIISIYQINCQAVVLTVDGSKSVEGVSDDMKLYLKSFYGFEVE